MSNADTSSARLDLFSDEEGAFATCDAALQWLARYRDSQGGDFLRRVVVGEPPASRLRSRG
jgi:hypothetical protein